jgi:ring-1,2-phenylacetyl-CoA epoxidase subunit PaaE
MGFGNDHIKKEHFTIDHVPPPPLMRDRSSKKITIHFKDQDYQIQASYPSTILEAALANHIQLPFSCRGGRCSTCAARCLQGTVVMSINEVLTEKDLREGWVLTCVGFAKTDIELLY